MYIAFRNCIKSVFILIGLPFLGTDANLTRSYYPPKVVLKYPSLPSPDSVKVAKEPRLILLRGDVHIDIWLLAKPEPVDAIVPGRPIPFMREPIKLAQIDSKHQDTIVTADISEDGKFIAYSTCRELRILYCRFVCYLFYCRISFFLLRVFFLFTFLFPCIRRHSLFDTDLNYFSVIL